MSSLEVLVISSSDVGFSITVNFPVPPPTKASYSCKLMLPKARLSIISSASVALKPASLSSCSFSTLSDPETSSSTVTLLVPSVNILPPPIRLSNSVKSEPPITLSSGFKLSYKSSSNFVSILSSINDPASSANAVVVFENCSSNIFVLASICS